MQIVIYKILPVVVFILLSFSFSRAQTGVDPDSALYSILADIKGDPLLLNEVLDHASENSTSLKQAEAAYLAASGSLRRERGFFDPEFYFNLNYQDLKEPGASFFASNIQITEQLNTQSALRLRIPTGTELELSLNTVRLETNNEFTLLNPQYNAFGSLSFRQSLLGGLTATGRKQLTYTELFYDAAKSRYDQEVLNVRSAAEQIYWNLYTAERDYAVQKLTRDRAEAFLNEAVVRNKAGLVGPNQVANARTFLAEQELLLIDLEEQLDSQSDQLAALIGIRPEYGRFKAVDNPPENFAVEPVEEILARVMDNNLVLQAAQKEIDAANSLVDAAGWEALPRLDFYGSLNSSGLGGNPQTIFFGDTSFTTATSGNFSEALSQVIKRKFPGWSIGVELSLPIGLRSGFGEKERLEAEVMGVQQRYTELSRLLERQVRTAHRELSHGNSRLKAASDGVEAAQEQVRIGMIEFQNGRITAFELVRLSEDFAVAQRRYSEALVKTINAVAALRQLTSGKYPAIN